MNHVLSEITPLLFPDADIADGSWFSGMHEDALKELPWDGLASPAVQIFYPLSPDVALIFSDPNYQKYNIPSDRRIRPLSLDEVQANNRHQLFQSNRFIFANRKELAFAQNEFLKDSYTRVPEHHSRLNEFGDLISELKTFAVLAGPGFFQKDQWKGILEHETMKGLNMSSNLR